MIPRRSRGIVVALLVGIAAVGRAQGTPDSAAATDSSARPAYQDSAARVGTDTGGAAGVRADSARAPSQDSTRASSGAGADTARGAAGATRDSAGGAARAGQNAASPPPPAKVDSAVSASCEGLRPGERAPGLLLVIFRSGIAEAERKAVVARVGGTMSGTASSGEVYVRLSPTSGLGRSAADSLALDPAVAQVSEKSCPSL
jgi:hypothetical protein